MPNVTDWLIDIGISEELLMVLVFIPILVTITTISRYITGIKTFGIYAPMVLSFAYYFMGARQGFTITILVIICSWLIRNFLRKVRLHYISRLAIVYTGNAILILTFIIATSFIPTDNPVFDFRNLQPIPVAVIISITDRFVSNYIKKDLFTALRLTTETVLVSLIGWTLMRVEAIKNVIINNIWIVPLTIIVSFVAGKYSGLRWTEFIRFNKVIRQVESENPANTNPPAKETKGTKSKK